MDQRRLKALQLLKRLKKHEMEQDVSELATLRLQLADLDRIRLELLDGIQHQSEASDIDVTGYMQQYLPAAKAEILIIADQMIQLEPHVTKLEDRVSDKFREYKTYDTLHKNGETILKQQEQDREVKEIEELNITRWTRNKRLKALHKA